MNNMTPKFKSAVLIASDRASESIRPDTTGPALENRLNELGYLMVCREVVPDNKDELISVLKRWADTDKIALILTSGGTGLAPRDVTSEATLEIIDRRVAGMEEAMRHASMIITPLAMLSRAVVGIRNKSLIINLPGSPKGALENLKAVEPALQHALELINGFRPDP